MQTKIWIILLSSILIIIVIIIILVITWNKEKKISKGPQGPQGATGTDSISNYSYSFNNGIDGNVVTNIVNTTSNDSEIIFFSGKNTNVNIVLGQATVGQKLLLVNDSSDRTIQICSICDDGENNTCIGECPENTKPLWTDDEGNGFLKTTNSRSIYSIVFTKSGEINTSDRQLIF